MSERKRIWLSVYFAEKLHKQCYFSSNINIYFIIYNTFILFSTFQFKFFGLILVIVCVFVFLLVF